MSIGAVNKKRSATGVEAPRGPDLSEARTLATSPAGPDLDSQGASGVPEHHEFALEYTDTRGRLWTGRFRCHVLGIREKIQVGVMKAHLSNHAPANALDQATHALLEMLAHCTLALDDAPGWARDLEKVKDAGVLQAIYTEVAQHEARFHGADGGDAGAEAGA